MPSFWLSVAFIVEIFARKEGSWINEAAIQLSHFWLTRILYFHDVQDDGVINSLYLEGNSRDSN